MSDYCIINIFYFMQYHMTFSCMAKKCVPFHFLRPYFFHFSALSPPPPPFVFLRSQLAHHNSQRASNKASKHACCQSLSQGVQMAITVLSGERFCKTFLCCIFFSNDKLSFIGCDKFVIGVIVRTMVWFFSNND
jgi:hypothetical protein